MSANSLGMTSGMWETIAIVLFQVVFLTQATELYFKIICIATCHASAISSQDCPKPMGNLNKWILMCSITATPYLKLDLYSHLQWQCQALLHGYDRNERIDQYLSLQLRKYAENIWCTSAVCDVVKALATTMASNKMNIVNLRNEVWLRNKHTMIVLREPGLNFEFLPIM